MGRGFRCDLGHQLERDAAADWTSADAAGLPILPGLVRYDEVAAGDIDHAIRITLRRTDRRYVWPASHQAGSADPTAAPMGAWLRLKSSVDLSRFGPQSQVVLRALQQHGGIVADNGSSWFLSGAPDSRWDNNDLHGLGGLHGSDFEFVDSSSLITDPDSGRVVTPPARSDVTGGVTLDGFGGLYRFVGGTGPRLGRLRGGPYWSGQDCARGIVLMPDGRSGYIVDSSGGVSRVAFGGASRPPRTRGVFTSPGQPLTRGIALVPDGTGGYTIDVQGGLHPFAVGPTNPVAPSTTGATHWSWSIARNVALEFRSSGRQSGLIQVEQAFEPGA